MKILIIGGSFSLLNGYTNAVASISKNFSNNQEVYVLPLYEAKDKNKYNDYKNVVILSKKLTIIDYLKMFKNFYGSYRLVSRYCNPLGLDCYLYLIEDLINRSVLEKVLNDINPDIINVHGVILGTWPFVEVLLKEKKPFCVTIHALSYHDPIVIINYNKIFEKDAFNVLMQENIPISTVSQNIKEIIQTKLIKNEYFNRSDLITVIQNGVDISRFNPDEHPDRTITRNRYNLPADKTIIIQVGSLSNRKNHISVLEAITKMPESLRNKIHYLVVGDGREKNNLIDFGKNANILDKCTFVGQVSDSELDNLYLASDLFILPSTSEGLSLVSLEAMAAGLPVIAFESLEGVKEIYHPETIQLIPSRDTGSMITAIGEAVDKKWDKNFIKNYSKKWSWEASCDGYIKLYSQTINRN